MHVSLLKILRCPDCLSALASQGEIVSGHVEKGLLHCEACARTYPIVRGIPRFAPAENYTDNFGVQWNTFQSTQLDSRTGQPVSRNRFVRYTGWSERDLKDQLVLDAGCGAGRFAEVALNLGARVVAVDFSAAIDAAKANLRASNAEFIQADINALPFAPGTFPYAYCLGVIQHTPNPQRSFDALTEVVAFGGKLAIDVYPRLLRNLLFVKYWIRPITRRLTPESSLRFVRKIFPALYPVSRAISRIPLAGHYLKYLIPVANYEGVYPLNQEQLREWALLDTFDMWAPAFDQPQTASAVRSWFHDAGFVDVEVFREGFVVGRGTKGTPADTRKGATSVIPTKPAAIVPTALWGPTPGSEA